MKKEKTGKWLLRKLKWHPLSFAYTVLIWGGFIRGIAAGANIGTMFIICLFFMCISALFYFCEWAFAGLYGED